VPEKGFKVSFKDKPEFHVRYVINATGMGHIIRDNPLLAQMAEKNYIASPKFGGVMTDPTTYQVKDPRKNQQPHAHVYAAGPPIFGSNPAVYAVESSAMAADVIAPTIVCKLIQKQELEEKQKHVHGSSRLFTSNAVETQHVSMEPMSQISTSFV
jgi:hypothetical protein